MAGSERDRAGSSPRPPQSDWGRLEAAFLSGWRSFWQSVGKDRPLARAAREDAGEEDCSLTRLPVSRGVAPPSGGQGWGPAGVLHGLLTASHGVWEPLTPRP